jgi:hypothetical protein
MGQYKQGLDYFPFQIGLLRDRKLRRPKLKYGSVVNDIYISLLELIYGDKGYYLEYSDKTKDDVHWEILENLQGKFQPTAETVAEVIEDLVACELFSGDQFKFKILTSKRIQQVYYSATVERKAVEIDFDKWLLTEAEMRKLSSKSFILQEFLNRPNENDNRPIERANRPNERESKEKESKVNKSRGCSSDYGLHGLVRLTEEEYGRIREEIGESALKDYINRLDSWLTGHKVSGSHANMILKWYNQDNPKGTGQTVSAVDVNALFGEVTEDTI